MRKMKKMMRKSWTRMRALEPPVITNPTGEKGRDGDGDGREQ